MDTFALWQARKIYTDNYVAYADIIDEMVLQQGKENTYQIEQNNACQRHWLGRFRRRTQIVSKNQEMVEISIALYARYRTNGTIEEISL